MQPATATLSFRPVTEDDTSFLYELYCSTRALEMSAIDWDNAQKQTFLQMQFNAQVSQYQSAFPTANHDIILRKNKPVGRLYIDRSQNEIRLLDIIINPKKRNHGIGSFCLKQLKNEATQANIPLRFYVWHTNYDAQRFYERHDCVELGEMGAYIFMGWHPTDDIHKFARDGRYSQG